MKGRRGSEGGVKMKWMEGEVDVKGNGMEEENINEFNRGKG